MILGMDGFDHYGDVATASRLRMLEGPYAEIDSASGAEFPSVGARTGDGALKIDGGAGAIVRRILDAGETTLYNAFGLYLPEIPSLDDAVFPLQYRDASNNVLYTLCVQSNGSVSLKAGETGTTIGQTSANAITAASWVQIETKIIINGSSSQFELRIEGEVVLNLTGLTLAGTIGQLSHRSRLTNTVSEWWIDDHVWNNASGTYNTGFLNRPRVATVAMRADDETGWTAQTRAKFGNGILELDGNGDAVTASDASALELGSGEYVLEAFVRFNAKPSGTNFAIIFSKWREGTNARSWRLFLGGASLNGGELEFQISTDGTSGTVATIMSAPFDPVLGHWYHIAVQRDGTSTVVFVDGVPLGAPASDSNTYHDNDALVCIGGLQNGATTILANTSVDGFMEEVRFTVGTARYNTTGFTAPAAAFGRNVGADTDFASVVLLLGCDTSITDESSYGRALTARGNAARFAVDDATGEYNTVNQVPPRDDTYVEAPYTAATGVLTLTANPSNNETVVFDSVTYTFKTALTPTAGEVLIGATATDSLDNLVAAINADAGSGTLYAAGTTPSTNASALNIGNSQMRVTANTPGAAGNAIGSTETLANGSWTGSTLSGGADIPGVSSFLMERLPPQTTGVKALALVTRARKTDSGDCKVQASFVTADDSSANGDEYAVTQAFQWYEDIIEEDPSTSAGLTPSSFVGARFRVDRTE